MMGEISRQLRGKWSPSDYSSVLMTALDGTRNPRAQENIMSSSSMVTVMAVVPPSGIQGQGSGNQSSRSSTHDRIRVSVPDATGTVILCLERSSAVPGNESWYRSEAALHQFKFPGQRWSYRHSPLLAKDQRVRRRSRHAPAVFPSRLQIED